MKYLILPLLLITLSCSESKNKQNNFSPQSPSHESKIPKSILAIFAHPDDESTVMPILTKYAGEGHVVNLVIASDGRYGVTDHAQIPAGDSLVAVRREEARCTCETLGINDPILLGYHDQLNAGESFARYNASIRGIRNKVDSLFQVFNPDIIITWGPDGYTGHPDHRIVGSIVSEVYMRTSWEKPVQLYYPGLPKEKMIPEASWLNPVNLSNLDVRIKVEESHLETMKEAWLCHKSQYTPEDIEGMMTLLKSVIGDTVYLRSLNPTETLKYEL